MKDAQAIQLLLQELDSRFRRLAKSCGVLAKVVDEQEKRLKAQKAELQRLIRVLQAQGVKTEMEER